MPQKHNLLVLVENKPGVMARISGLIARRGFNIDSISVGTTQNPEISVMTLVVEGEEHQAEQIAKQLNKLIDVIKVVRLSAQESIERELALVKLKLTPQNRDRILELARMFDAKIADASQKAITLEVVGDESKVGAFIQLASKFELEELVRTGKTVMRRG